MIAQRGVYFLSPLWEYVSNQIIKISTLSLYDYVCIKAHYTYISEDKFNCDEKIKKYGKRTGYERAKEMVQKENGCNQYFDNIKYYVDNIGYKSCLCTFKHPDMNYYLTLFNQYDKGVLPFKGSLTEQPNKIVEVFNLITGLKAEREQESLEKIKNG